VDWFRDHPVVADGLLALLIAAISIAVLRPLYVEAHAQQSAIREPDWLAYLLTLVTTLPLSWRRRFPQTVLIVVGTTTIVFFALQYSGEAIGVLLATYTVAAHCPRRKAFVSLVFAYAGLLLSLFFIPEDVGPVVILVNLVVFSTAWILGSNLQARRLEHAELADRAVRLENDREQRARRAVSDERSRIARELHDVVAHNVSVMVVQAAGARRTLDRDPARAKEVLAGIEETGRQALTEMRRLLGVLRTDDDATNSRAPQPGVSRLDDLVDNVRAAGLPVQLTVEGIPKALSAGVDLSAYRIVQEALTNSLKHAGPAVADVVLRYDVNTLEVTVRDTGRGSAAALEATPDGGNGAPHGLVGMRERVALFGGELHAGPRPGGGFEVVARLPVEPAAS
jgi:signal transduction histidine kinase